MKLNVFYYFCALLVLTFLFCIPPVYSQALPITKPDSSVTKAQPLKISDPKTAAPEAVVTDFPAPVESVSKEQFEDYKSRIEANPQLSKYIGYTLLAAGVGRIVSSETPSTIFVAGKPQSGGVISSNLTMFVFTQGYSDIVAVFPKSLSTGAAPSFELHDVTDDKLADVILTIPTGGSGAAVNCLIYTCKNDKAYVVYPHSKVPMFFKGRFEPGYKALLFINNVIKKEINLSSRKQLYDAQGIYKDGKVITTETPWMFLTSVKPFANNAGFYSLECFYIVKGISNVDSIAEIRSVIVYSDSRKAWQFRSASIRPVK